MKLSPENVAYIEEAVTLGTLTYKALADKFGVSIGTINKTVKEFRGRKASMPSTPAKARVPGPTLAERSVALQHLEADDLHGQLQSSLTDLSIFGRSVSAEIRIRLLPMLKEVKRRYDTGETVNNVKGYHAYLHSLGLTPSTVRSWTKRNEQKILGDVLKSTGATREINQKEKKYERELKDGIEQDIRFAKQDRKEREEEEEFERRLKQDPEFRRQQEEKFVKDSERLHEARKQAPKTEQERLAQEDRIKKLMSEIINDGFKQRSKKYHPDTGGSTEQFQELAQAKAELQRLIEESGRRLAKRFAA